MRRLLPVLLGLLLLTWSCAKKATEPPPPEPPPPETPFTLLTATQTDSTPVIVKANTKTGEAWYRAYAENAYGWKPIKDPAPPPPSDYEFEIVIGKDSWNLVRLDLRRGRGWGTESGEWKEYSAPPAAAGGP